MSRGRAVRGRRRVGVNILGNACIAFFLLAARGTRKIQSDRSSANTERGSNYNTDQSPNAANGGEFVVVRARGIFNEAGVGIVLGSAAVSI